MPSCDKLNGFVNQHNAYDRYLQLLLCTYVGRLWNQKNLRRISPDYGIFGGHSQQNTILSILRDYVVFCHNAFEIDAIT